MPPYTPENPNQSSSINASQKTLVPMLSAAVQNKLAPVRRRPPSSSSLAPAPRDQAGSTRPKQLPDRPTVHPIPTQAEPSSGSAALDQLKDGNPTGAAIGAVFGAGTGLWWGKSPTAAAVGAGTGGVVGYFSGSLIGALVGGLAGYIASKVT